ncbi:MAG: nucleotidyltransferase family protein [Aedoeadaptatus pacaensis]
MPYALIVAETNPLHYGHTNLIQCAKDRGYSVIVLMSGSFTQRGIPVVTDKFSRAEDLIAQGVDLVITHPVQSATSAGELFSYGAMCAATRLPAIDAVFCGTEFGDEDVFAAMYDYEQTEAFKNRLKKTMNAGASYAAAYKKAFAEKDPQWEMLFQSNALLAYGYYKSLRKLSSAISFKMVPRKKSASILSASALRAMNEVNAADVKVYCAGTAPAYRESELCAKLFHIYRSALLTSELDLSAYDGYEIGIDQRINKLIRSATDFHAFLDQAKTKRYSRWRIARLLLHHQLAMDRDSVRASVENQKAYQVLAFSDKGTDYLRLAKTSSTNLLTTYKQIKKLPTDQQRILSFEERATDMWSVLTETEMGRDYLGF